MSTTISGIRIVDMPDLGAVADGSSFVGEHAGSGRFSASALSSYVQAAIQPQITAAAAAAVAALGNTGRNLVHNPLFNVVQRGAGPFNTNGAYGLDRWRMGLDAGDVGSIVAASATDSDRSSIGDERAGTILSYAFTGAAGAANIVTLQQPIESARRLAGKTVTLSFYAVGSTPLKLGASLDQIFGTGGSPSATMPGNGQSATIAMTWARYSLTFNMASVAGKTFGTNGNDYTNLILWLSAGSNSASRSGNIGVQSGTINLWGVQLETGGTMTALEKPDPRYDISNCQRFYQSTVSTLWEGAGTSGIAYATTCNIFPMRALPTITIVNNNSLNMGSVSVTPGTVNAFQVNGTALSTAVVALGVNATASAEFF